MWIAGIILASWLVMAFQSPTKEMRRRRLIVVAAVVVIGFVLRHYFRV
jgi:hypothetical protein